MGAFRTSKGAAQVEPRSHHYGETNVTTIQDVEQIRKSFTYRPELSLVFNWKRALRHSRLPFAARAVGVFLQEYGDSDGRNIRPGHDALAEDAGCDERTVRRALKRLEADAWIEVDRRFKAAGRGPKATNVYRLCIPDAILRGGTESKRGDSLSKRGGTESPEDTMKTPGKTPDVNVNASSASTLLASTNSSQNIRSVGVGQEFKAEPDVNRWGYSPDSSRCCVCGCEGCMTYDFYYDHFGDGWSVCKKDQSESELAWTTGAFFSLV